MYLLLLISFVEIVFLAQITEISLLDAALKKNPLIFQDNDNSFFPAFWHSCEAMKNAGKSTFCPSLR